jgi:hypothetical protein
VYASIVSFGFRLLYNCNTRYEWLVRPYSPGTSTLEEAPSFAWRTNGLRYLRWGVDNVREQKKLKARKMLEKAQNPHPSSARFVSRLWIEKPLFIL